MFVRETLIDLATLHIDQMGVDVGRLGGQLYARQRDQFERVAQPVEEFMATAESG